jgi:hypothetical protein
MILGSISLRSFEFLAGTPCLRPPDPPKINLSRENPQGVYNPGLLGAKREIPVSLIRGLTSMRSRVNGHTRKLNCTSRLVALVAGSSNRILHNHTSFPRCFAVFSATVFTGGGAP